MNSPVARRVVVTGLGLVTPLGDTIDGVWSALLAGRSGIRRVEPTGTNGFPCRIAGVLPNFQPDGYLLAKDARRMARVSQGRDQAETRDDDAPRCGAIHTTSP